MATLTKAIPQDRYIRINSVNIGDVAVAGRSFGGLVFTEGKGWAPDAGLTDDDGKPLTGVMPEDYLVVVHSAAQAYKYFAEGSAERKFADRYFSFLTPAGGIPRVLTYVRRKVTDADGNLLKWVVIPPDSDSDSSDETVYGWVTEDGTEVANPVTEKPNNALVRVSEEFSNFGSVCFIDDDVTCKDVADCGNTANTSNYRYLYAQSVYGEETDEEATDNTKVSDIGPLNLNAYLRKKYNDGIRGLALVYGMDVISAQMPMALFAATDYTTANSAADPMFKQFPGELAMVTDSDTADKIDPCNINYNGRTQYGSGTVAFYQRGRNFDGEDTCVYCNEVWLKAAVAAEVMDLFLNTNRVDAGAKGEALIYTTIDAVARNAIANGVIEIGKTLTDAQRRNVTQATGDTEAWFAVQTFGYWLDVRIVHSDGTDDRTQPNDYKAVYTLCYSKGDSIKFVEGTHYLV